MQNLLVVTTTIINRISSILKTKISSTIQLGRLLVVMIIIVKIVLNVVNTITKAQINLCQMTATLLIIRPGLPFFLAPIMPVSHHIVLQAVTTHQAIMTHQVVAHGVATHGAVVALMAAALAEAGKTKKRLAQMCEPFLIVFLFLLKQSKA